MVRKQKGFTIIELVVVIVILGILAAVAFPKFQDLSGDAKTAVLNGAKAAIISSAVITYSKKQGTAGSIGEILGNTVLDSGISTAGSACGAVTLTYTAGSVTIPAFSISDYCS